MQRYKIAKSKDKSLYGIVDNKGTIIVDFLYDDIHNIGEFCWPGPGPLPPPDRFFIGAFSLRSPRAFPLKDRRWRYDRIQKMYT